MTYHVTLPSQPLMNYIEGILKLAAPLQVLIVSPANGAQIMSIPYDRIRRFGCEVVADFDLVWFETCGCRGTPQQFFYFSVPSGIEVSFAIVNEIKRGIETALRSFVIQEECDKEKCQLTYISRSHYGCGEYPETTRQNIIQKGLISIAASPGRSESQRQMSAILRHRRANDITVSSTVGQRRDSSRRESSDIRRGTVTDISPSTTSPIHRSVSPPDSGTRMTLSTLSQKPLSMAYNSSRSAAGLSSSAGSGDLPKRDVADLSRNSAPSHCNFSGVKSEKKPPTFLKNGKRLSLDEIGSVSRIQRQKKVETAISNNDEYNRLESISAISNNDEYNHLESISPYKHVPPQTRTFESTSLPRSGKKEPAKEINLSASFNGISLKSQAGRRKAALDLGQ